MVSVSPPCKQIYFMCSTEVCMPSGSPCADTCFDGKVCSKFVCIKGKLTLLDCKTTGIAVVLTVNKRVSCNFVEAERNSVEVHKLKKLWSRGSLDQH